MSGVENPIGDAPAGPPGVLYRDQRLCAMDKPPGMLVHFSKLSTDREFLVDRVREHFGCRVYPLHRLDRATSGVMLFAFDRETAAAIGRQFQDRQVTKIYHAVARGYTEQHETIDYPLSAKGRSEPRPAVTRYRRLATVELPIPVGRYATGRYSLVEVQPQTGRTHQIRRHFKHVFHPLIGDTTYGEGRHNRLFRERFGCRRLLLHATSLAFRHPETGRSLRIAAPPCPDMDRVVRMLFGNRFMEAPT